MSDLILPNIRKLYIPDPGYDIYDADLAGADAQVVAWEANDNDLKDAFRAGVKIHAKNALDMFGPERAGEDGMRMPLYRETKSCVHGTNYGGTPRGIAPKLGWIVKDVEAFQDKWFYLHPGIKDWHHRIEESLWDDRTVVNKFGYDRIFFDRPESLLPEALAWVPQSTVALVTFKGALRLQSMCPWVDILLQVHDSLVFQMRKEMRHTLPKIKEALHVTIPYDDPLTIPWGIARSSTSWGECKDISWDEAT